jgi:flagellar biosynthesis protein FlhF
MSISQKDHQLHVKSYFAASVKEAMAQALQELGADALLLTSREAPPEARHLGEYEIVFAGSAGGARTQPAAEELRGIQDLCQQMDKIRDLLTRLPPDAISSKSRPPAVQTALIEAGVEPALAQEIELAVRQRTGKGGVLEIARVRTLADSSPDALLAETLDELNRRFEVAPELGRITAFVGPPGSGKTTALVKLAITQGLLAGRPVRIYSADTQRIAAVEQLRTYAAIVGVPFQSVESSAELAQAIDSAPANALLLIDTPGYSGAMLQGLGSDLASFLSRRQDIDTHLVLTASMRPADLRRTADLFGVFNYSKLLFTKLDETTSYAAIFCEAARRQRPLSFFCNGQTIPEDIEPASQERITESLVRQLPEAVRAVA